MISYIRGELVGVEEGKVIVEVAGIGYGVYMSNHSIDRLPGVGNEVSIHTYLNVKEDAMQLFGFLTADDLNVFKLIIAVNGIGPKGGLNILSKLSPDELRFAVAENNVKAISLAPGIGKKTAEKLIIELRDKLSLEDALENLGQESASAASLKSEAGGDAIEALIALGYSSTEAVKAVRKIKIDETLGSDDILKLALKHIV